MLESTRLLRILQQQVGLQEIPKQVMVTQPKAVFFDQQNEQVALQDRLHHRFPGTVRRLAQQRLAQFRIEFFHEGSAQEKIAHFGGLLIQYLVCQVIVQLDARSAL